MVRMRFVVPAAVVAGRGWSQRTKYLSSVQAGPEIFTGEGTLDTSAYSVTIG